jgi:hypothetical protein
MKTPVANITLPTVRPTLEVVGHEFETWRKRRCCRGPIPESLWEAAVGHDFSLLRTCTAKPLVP